VVEPGGRSVSYQELDALTDRVRDRLRHLGVQPGDRVGLMMHKTVDSLAVILGALKAGAAYVPVDAEAPAARCAYILNDCGVSAVFCDAEVADPLRSELEQLGRAPLPPMLVLPEAGAGHRLDALLDREDATDPIASGMPAEDAEVGPDDLAYILYTSGSTGRPKGVMLTHRNAISYVDWCGDIFRPTEEDRFSSHAPFHFDLSILDLYVPLAHGATLVLIGETLGKEPLALAEAIAEQRISVWYSTPSILNLLTQYGKLDRYDYGALRLVLFAGEVFPVAQLRQLKAHWPEPRYFNLYGPTETNVCTYYEVPRVVPEDRTEPYPIGWTCEHLDTRVVDVDGRDVEQGEEGELVVTGPGVMVGYWNLPEQNERAFLRDDGRAWYRTGDLVVEEEDGLYVFHGRRDRMVKRRGYRVELGEIEAGLSNHRGVKEVAVVAVPDGRAGLRIRAALAARDGHKLSVIEMKQYSMTVLPPYMVPDVFQFLEALPRTSTDKIDYQALKL